MAAAQPREPKFLGYRNPTNGFHQNLEATARVRARLEDRVRRTLDVLYMTLGMIPNASRRIMTELQPNSVLDHCAIFHASRLNNNCLAAVGLFLDGLLVEATTITRAALECASQAIVFLHEPKLAEQWWNGKQFSPGDIRRRISKTGDLSPLYKSLSDIAHANPGARMMHAIQLKQQGYAVSFGGAYRPKAVAYGLLLLTDIAVQYLWTFYNCYFGRLAVDFWPVPLEIAENVVRDVRTAIDGWPPDEVELEQFLSTQLPTPPMDKAPISEEVAHDLAIKARARWLERVTEAKGKTT